MLYDTYAPWSAAEAVTVGKRKKVDVNGKGMYVECSTAGTTGGTEPDWWPELVTNGTFDTDLTGWTVSADWLYSGGKAHLPSSGGLGKLVSTAFVEGGSVYRCKVTYSSSEGSGDSSVKFRVWSNADGTGTLLHSPASYIGYGDNEFLIVTTESGYLGLQNVYSTAKEQYFDNISVRLADIPTTTITDNTATWDITPTNYYTYRGCLIEEARTNSALYSDEYNVVGWQEYSVTRTDAQPDPYGTNTARKYREDGGNTTHLIDYCQLNLASDTRMTVGYLVKNISAKYVKLTCDSADLNRGEVIFNLESNAVHWTGTQLSGVLNGYGIERYGEWLMLWLDVSKPVSTVHRPTLMFVADNGADESFVGNGRELLVQHKLMQLGGGVPSSLIPTTTAAVTRNADVLSYDTANWYADGKAGTMQVDADLTNHGVNLFQPVLELGLNSTNRQSIQINTANTIKAFSTKSGSTQYDMSLGSVARGDATRLVLSSDTNDAAFTSDGLSVLTDNTVALQTTLPTLLVGNSTVNATSQFNGCLLNIIYYQKRLANSVIEANSAREYSND